MSYEPSVSMLLEMFTAITEASDAVDAAARAIAIQTGDNVQLVRKSELVPEVPEVPKVLNDIPSFETRADYQREVRRLNRITREGKKGALSEVVAMTGNDGEEGLTTKYMVKENNLQQSQARQRAERELMKRGINYERVPVKKYDAKGNEVFVWQGGHKVYETVGLTPSDEREIQKLRDRGVITPPTMLRSTSVREDEKPFIERFGEQVGVTPTSYMRTPEQLVKGVQPDRVGRGRLNNYFDQYQNVLDVATPDNPYSREIVDIISKLKEKLTQQELEQIYYEIDTDPEMEAGSIEYMYSDVTSPLMPRLQRARDAWERIADRHGIEYERAEVDDIPMLNGAMDYAPISEQFALATKGLL